MGTELRRRDKEITDPSAINEIFRKGKFCHIAMVDNEKPYLITMNYGYRDNTLYLHAALEGKKIDVLKRRSEVCFQIVTETRLKTGEDACGDWTMKFKSLVGYGEVSFITEHDEKIKALNILMDQYTTRGPFEFPQKNLDETAVMKLSITSLTGKSSGY